MRTSRSRPARCAAPRGIPRSYLRALVLLLCLASAPLASAATVTWSGGGGDDLWSTGSNWIGGVAPTAGDDLVFAGSTRLTPTSDYANATSFASVTFSATAGAFTIGGNRISITGAITNNSAATQTLACDISGTYGVDGSSGAIVLSGGLGLNGLLTKSGSHTLTLSGTTDNVGFAVTANAGLLILAKTSSSGVHAIGGATLTINGATVKLGGSGGDQLFDDATILVNSGTFDTNGLSEAFNTLSGAGIIDNTGGGASVLTIGQTGGGSGISGTIRNTTGTLALVKAGTGTMSLSGTNTYTGGTTISAGKLSYSTDAALSGTGAIILNGGTLLHTGPSTLANAVSVTASSTIESDDGDDLTLSTSSFTGTGGTTLSLTDTTSSGIHSLILTGSGFTYAGGIALDSNSRVSCGNTGGTQTFSGVISGLGNGGGVDGAVKRSVAGGVTMLSGANTYTGGTLVDVGTLVVTGSTAAASAVTVNSDGTLSGTGTLAGTVSVASGGTVAPGILAGPTASFVASSLRAVTDDDWRLTRTTTGTRTDALIYQPTQAFGTGAERASFMISGDDGNWETFSVQWDGYLQVPTGGTDLSTRSDDGSRVWLDLNGDGVVQASEWGSNGWGFGQAETTRTVQTAVPAGTYRMRVQYEEGNGGNAMYLLWNDAGHSAGTVTGLSLVPADYMWTSTIGTLTSGALTFASGATFSVDLDGTTPTRDRLSNASTVTCGGRLAVGTVTNSALGKVYTVVSAATVAGTFTGLPNGAMLEVSGRTLQIAYTATTVTLTDVAHPTTRVWDGGGADDNWTTAANWDFDIAPQAGDALQFAGSTRLTPVDDFPAGTSFASITFASGAGQFVIGPTASALGTISRQVWTGIGGNAVSLIPVTTTANINDTLTSLEGPANWADVYGTRVRGFVVPPTTGDYTFWLNTDDDGELWLSTDMLPANKVLIATNTIAAGLYQWNAQASQKSAPIALVAGRRYYIEALQKEGVGGDYLQVGWAKPGEATVVPSQIVPGSQLLPYSTTVGITLAGGITNNSGVRQTMNLGLIVDSTCTVACASGDIVLGGTVGGAGGLSKTGAGGLTLGGANDFQGGVGLTAGALALNSATALGATAGTLTIANGTTLDNASGSAVIMTANNPQTWNGDFTFTGTNSLNLGSGAVAMGAASRHVTVAASTLGIGGAIGGAGGLVKQGGGTLELAGASTYAGGTDVLAGTLKLGSTLLSGFGTNGTGWTLNGATVASDVATLTDNGLGEGRGLFLTTPIGITGFNVSFRYLAAGDRIADGVAFVLQNDGRGAFALGPGGGSLGYGGISPSAAVALNIFPGHGKGTAFFTGGNAVLAFTPSTPVDLASGDPILVSLRYDGATTLDQTVRDVTTGDTVSSTLTIADLTTTVGAATAYLGFTGGTGGAAATQTISNLVFNSGGANRLPATTALSIASGATVDLGGKVQQVGSLADNGGGGGTVTNNGLSDATLTVSDATSTTFSGVISDGATYRSELVRAGSGTLTLAGTSTATGATTVNGGMLLVTGATAAGSAVTVASGATLGGSGTVAGTVTLQAGSTLAPGAGGTAIGTLATGAVTASATATFSVDLNGSGPIADRASSTGAVALAGTLTVAGISNAAAGRTYTIASGSAVSGTFSGLANGATFTQQARTFQILYHPTSVELVDATAVAPATRTWDGGGSDNRWTTAANWVGDVAPLPGDSLIFAGATRLAPDADYGADTGFASISFANGASAFLLASTLGRRITLAGPLTNNGSTTQTVNVAVVMAATRTVDAASGDLTIASVLSGAGGLTKSGAGKLTLFGANVYTGATTISAGTLEIGGGGTISVASAITVGNSGTLQLTGTDIWGIHTGTTSSPIIVNAGGSLTTNNSFNTLVDLTLNGGTVTLNGGINADFPALALKGTVTVGGGQASLITAGSGNNNVILVGTNAAGGATTFAVADATASSAADLLISVPLQDNRDSGNAAVASGITKSGAGTLTLSAANTYSGATTVSAGTLKAGVATQAFGIASATTVANTAGATLDITGFSNAIGSLAGGGGTGGALVLGAATLTCGGDNTDTTYAGVISGTGGLTKTGNGTLTLAGTLANTASGTTTILAGNLVLQKTAGVTALAGDVTLGDGSGTDVLRLAASDQIADTAIITFTSGGGGNSAKLELNGYLETVGGIQTSAVGQAAVIQDTEVGGPAGPNSPAVLTISPTVDCAYDGLIRDGGGQVRIAKAGSATQTLRCGFGAHDLTFSGGVTISAGRLVLEDVTFFPSAIANSSATADALTFNQAIRDLSYGSVISGSGAVTKSGTGKLNLSAVDTFTGALTAGGGLLLVTGSTAAGSAVTVASGATLGGSGTTAGTVTVANGGALAPGAGGSTINTLSTGAVTFGATATLSVDLDGTAPSADVVASTGAATRGGTLTVASIANAAIGKVYTILTSASASGTFSGLADGAVFSQAGRLFRIAYTATAVTLTDCAPLLTARQTRDADGDGHLDHIRLTFDQALNDDFSGFTVTVAGYAVTSYDTGVANDAVVDVVVTPLASGDTGATPAVRITANTTLKQLAGTGLIQAEGSATAATDAASPVLLSAAWTDGGTAGVSFGDTVTLTFSESVTAASMTVADLGLPVSGDTLSSTAIANQSGTTLTTTLAGTPRLTPGGAYSALATSIGKATGIFVAAGNHLHDAVGLTAATGSAASAVDLGPGTTSVAIARATGSDPKSWALGTLTVGTVADSITSGLDLTILDVGDCTVDLVIASTATAPSTWAPAGSAGANTYLMKADASGAATGAPTVAGSYPLTLTTSAQALSSGLRSGTTVPCALYFQAPTSITSGSTTQQTIVITVTASLAP